MATALRVGGGAVVARAGGAERMYSERLYCTHCSIGYEELDPRLFSFNSRQGACESCDGIGSITTFEPERLIVDPEMPIGKALLDALDAGGAKARRAVKQVAKRHRVPLERPLAKLTARQRRALFDGEGAAGRRRCTTCSRTTTRRRGSPSC